MRIRWTSERGSRRAASLALAAVMAMLLSACATGIDTATPSPTAAQPSAAQTSEGETAEPEPTDTAPPLDLSNPASWLIGADTVGPLRIGDSFDEAAALLADEGWTRGCGALDENAAVLSSPSAGGARITVAARYDETTGDRGDDIGTIILLGDVAGQPKTADGLGVGSTLVEVEAGRPDAETIDSFGQGYHGVVARTGAIGTWFGARSSDDVETVQLTAQSQPPLELCG